MRKWQGLMSLGVLGIAVGVVTGGVDVQSRWAGLVLILLGLAPLTAGLAAWAVLHDLRNGPRG